MASKIEWTEETRNVFVGCSKTSPGCKNCYAEKMARRLKAMGNPHYGVVIDDNGKWNGKVHFVGDAIAKMLRSRKPKMIFVNSMSDTFHESVPVEWLDKLWNVMGQTRWNTYQILTKRAKRMYEYLKDKEPLPNVWCGVSVENQAAADERIPFLLQTPAAIRFLSCEPLLGPIDLDGYIGTELQLSDYDFDIGDGVDFVIVGGESGPKARPCHPDWVRSIRDQCQLFEVSFFFKQWGGTNKKKSGNLLDGKVWQQMPQMMEAQ